MPDRSSPECPRRRRRRQGAPAGRADPALPLPGSRGEGREGGRRTGAHDPFDRGPQVGGLDRLGQEVVHAGRQAPLAVLLPRPRRQGDDGQVAPRGALPLPDRPDDLEAVQLRHVDVQQQQVEGPRLRQRQRLPAVARHTHPAAAPPEQLLQELRVELVVLGQPGCAAARRPASGQHESADLHCQPAHAGRSPPSGRRRCFGSSPGGSSPAARPAGPA